MKLADLRRYSLRFFTAVTLRYECRPPTRPMASRKRLTSPADYDKLVDDYFDGYFLSIPPKARPPASTSTTLMLEDFSPSRVKRRSPFLQTQKRKFAGFPARPAE